MSVVGIDFGLDTCYISVARSGGIETVANDYSMRDSPSVVGFGDRQRVMCVGAKSQLLTNIKRTFFAFKSLLGRKFDDPVVQKEVNNLPYAVSRGDNGNILIKVDYLSKSMSFTPEQITAMLFTKLKETADAALGSKIKDVVISTPVYYTDRERRALLDAASIAGLNVLKLMNDTTATALAYGIYKQDLPAVEEKPRNVIFVDCGHRGIQTAACSFNKGKLVMQAAAFDPDCGGRIFNEALVRYFAEDFKTRYKVDPYKSPKALLKLFSEVEKLKKQMSANTNKLPLNIECFMEDKDVHGSVDRAAFEEMITPQLSRIEAVLKECLESSKWKQDEIYAVEIVGGSTRIPAIKSLIEKIFGKTPNTTLNADEAVSRGCALQCAMISPTFKVREFSVTDIQPFPIKLKWKTDGDVGDMVVFPKFHAVPFAKMLTFFRKENFSVEAEYENAAEAGLPDSQIGTFEIGEVKPNKEDNSNQKIKVKIRVNKNGIFTVATASYSEKHEVEEEVEVPMEVEENNGEKTSSTDNNGKTEQTDNKDEPMDQSSSPPEQKEDEKEKKEEEKKPEVKMRKEKRKKTVTKTIDLPVTSRAIGSLLSDKLEQFIEVEKNLANQDLQEKDRLTAKNAVEEYIYDIRAKIHDELIDFIAEEQRNSFSNELEDAENWLYEEGEDCAKNVYEDKLKALKAKGEPAKVRKTEFESRGRAIESLGLSLQLASKVIELYNKGDEKFDHLDKAEVEKAVKMVAEKRQWLDEKAALLSSTPKTVDPPLLTQQFYTEKTSFEKVVNPILNKSKPKVEPPPPPAKEEGKKDEKQQQQDVNGDQDQQQSSEQASSTNSNMDLD